MKQKLMLHSISKVSDDELLGRLSELLQNSRRVESELIAHIGEVDQRRLYARQTSSMFVYCTEILHLSEHEAYLRIEVARASRKHPVLLEMLADGRLHLSGIAILHRQLTEANQEVLLKRATHKSKRQIEELVAELSPKPDIPATIRKMPERWQRPKPLSAVELGPERVSSAHPEPEKNTREEEAIVASPATPAPERPAVVKPIAAARYKVEFTTGTELRYKLERLRSLMRSSVPDGDLATLIEMAVTEKLERLESKRYGKTKAPRKSLKQADTSASSRNIPAPIKRAVHERDRGRCTFRDENGRRCTETRMLEFHHLLPYGQGGDHRMDNVVLACRTHNLYLAERDYGRAIMKRYRTSGHLPSRVSELKAVYTLSNRATRATALFSNEVLVPDRVRWSGFFARHRSATRRSGEDHVSSLEQGVSALHPSSG